MKYPIDPSFSYCYVEILVNKAMEIFHIKSNYFIVTYCNNNYILRVLIVVLFLVLKILINALHIKIIIF